MANNNSDHERYNFKSLLTAYRLLALGFGLLIVAILLLQNDISGDQNYILTKLFGVFIRDLGFAIIIAVIIAVAIEMVARQEFNETINNRVAEIQEHVFKSTYSRNISRELIGEIDASIFQANFMRRNHRLVYRMRVEKTSSLDPADKSLPDISVVICDVDMSYEIENISASVSDYTIKIEVEKPPFDTLKRFTRITGVSVSVSEQSAVVEKFDTLANDTPNVMYYEREIKKLDPGKKIFVRGSWRMIKSLDDSEVWRSILPSDGMILCVNRPKEAHVFDAHSLHRVPLDIVVEGPDYCEWRIKHAVLPHQGIIFWWRCSSPPSIGENESRAADVVPES